MKITHIQHSCFLIEYQDKTIVLDPFTTNLESVIHKCPKFLHPDLIIVSHGHDDHMGSLFDIIGKNTQVIGIVELCSYLKSHGVNNTLALNFGGTASFQDLEISFVPASHTSSNNDVYLGAPAGIIIKSDAHTLYHFGDTGLFAGMSMIKEYYNPDIALIPVGGRYTMDIKQAAYACNNIFDFKTIIPMHYNTFQTITVDISEFVAAVKKGNVLTPPLNTEISI